MKILSIVGARPQFIKLAPLSKEVRKHHEEVILHTGQHYDVEMSDLFFDEFRIPEPDYNLCVGSGSPGYQLSEMIKGVEKIIVMEKPDLVITFGDTNSTLAGALSAIQNHIPAVHVEAGPRNKWMDVPEMINRLVADRISPILFCATDYNYEILKKEGLAHRSHFVGDLMYDIFLKSLGRIKDNTKVLSKFNVESNNYHLATCHRAENTDSANRLRTIVAGLIQSKEKIIFSLHPRTEKMLKQFKIYGSIKESENILPIKPIGYFEFVQLQYYAKKIITDSGGVQREAYFLKKPCINIYDHTYWPEIRDDGWQVVTGIDEENIALCIKDWLPSKEQSNIFGDGNAAPKIVKIINDMNFNNIFKYSGHN